ncbi:S8 family serine peptidase [Nitriliruptoraceae bacterium ZYF776]|nr:S8 family serine peptidase [Profundirhabdus halotolerans]
MKRAGARRGSSVLVAAAVAAATVVPLGLGTAAADEPVDLGPPRYDPTEVRLVEAADVDASDAELPDAPTPSSDAAAPETRAADAGTASIYHDFCGDSVVSNLLDLREVRILDSRSSDGRLGVEWATCGPTSIGDLQGRFLVVSLGTDLGANFSVQVTARDGRLRGAVLDRSGRTVATATPSRTDGGHRFTVRFPASAIGSPGAFVFDGSSADRGGDRVLDRVPERDEEPALWPASCTTEPFPRRTLEAAPGQLEVALAAATEAGLQPGAVDPHSGRFDVVAGDEAAAAQLTALDGVAHVDETVVYERAGSASGSDAWWRTQVDANRRTDRTGAGVTIAIVDDGIDGARSELRGRVGPGRDLVRGRAVPAGARSDRGGHGTAVAGVAAANSSTVRGIAPAAQVRPYNVFDAGGCATDTAITAAVDRARADRVDVINLSLGNDRQGTQPALGAALDRAAAAGITIIAASGNSGQNGPASPGDHRATIAVGATLPGGSVAPYSNGGSWLDLVAPGGTGEASATRSIRTLGERGGFVDQAGTSFAAPVVSGAAARYLAASDANASTFRQRVIGTAVDLPPAGRDVRSGYGRLDIGALLADSPNGRPAIRDVGPACRNAPRGPFRDARDGVHAAPIACIAHWRVAAGYPDGTFRPTGTVTRGQMATFIANLITRSGGSLPSPSATFPDTRGSVHQRAIRQLATAGIVSGFPDGTYRPQAAVTRGQMATFLVRAAERVAGQRLPRRAAGFHDTRFDVHEERIEQAATAGLTGGDGQGFYEPGARLTRRQMASFLARTLSYLVSEAGVRPPR